MIKRLQHIFLSKEKKYNKANQLIKRSSQLAKEKKYELAIKKIHEALVFEDRIEWAEKLANYYFKSGDLRKANEILSLYKEKGKGDPLNQFGYDTWYFERKRIWEKEKSKKQLFEAMVELKSIITMAMYGDNFSLDSCPNLRALYTVTLEELKPDLHYIREKYLDCSNYHYEHCMEKELDRFERTNDFVWHCYQEDERATKCMENFQQVIKRLEKSI